MRAAAFRSLVASIGAVLAGALAAPDARAFCRTTTQSEPSGYDPSMSGCWTKGTALAWHTSPVGYTLVSSASTQVSFADATAAVAAAFGKWSSADCSTTDTSKHPSIAFHDQGPVDSAANDCGLITCDPTIHDQEHVIVFRDDTWPHNDPNNTLALTTVTFGVNSGELFDADMEINTHDHLISAATPTPSGAFDLETILTHETGHFLGLAHSTDASAVMFVRYAPGRTALSPDDALGVCTVYPPQGPKAAGCACGATRADGADGAAFAAPGLALALVLVMARRTRRTSTSSRGNPSST